MNYVITRIIDTGLYNCVSKQLYLQLYICSRLVRNCYVHFSEGHLALGDHNEGMSFNAILLSGVGDAVDIAYKKHT